MKGQLLAAENGILYFWSILPTLLAFGKAWSERLTAVINRACQPSVSEKSQLSFSKVGEVRVS